MRQSQLAGELLSYLRDDLFSKSGRIAAEPSLDPWDIPIFTAVYATWDQRRNYVLSTFLPTASADFFSFNLESFDKRAYHGGEACPNVVRNIFFVFVFFYQLNIVAYHTV